MRKLTLIAALGAGVALGGCATTTPVAVSGAVSDVTTQIQQTAVSVCSFLPTAEFVADLLSVGNPIVMTVQSVANTICKAATSQSARRGHRTMVNGVPLRGRFVRS